MQRSSCKQFIKTTQSQLQKAMDTVDLKQRIALRRKYHDRIQREPLIRRRLRPLLRLPIATEARFFIGVSDRQDISGITVGKETLRDVSNRIAQATEPRVIVDVESVDVVEKSVLVVHIAEASIKPVSVKGVCYKRVGNSNRVIATASCLHKRLPRCISTPLDRVGINS